MRPPGSAFSWRGRIAVSAAIDCLDYWPHGPRIDSARMLGSTRTALGQNRLLGDRLSVTTDPPDWSECMSHGCTSRGSCRGSGRIAGIGGDRRPSRDDAISVWCFGDVAEHDGVGNRIAREDRDSTRDGWEDSRGSPLAARYPAGLPVRSSNAFDSGSSPNQPIRQLTRDVPLWCRIVTVTGRLSAVFASILNTVPSRPR